LAQAGAETGGFQEGASIENKNGLSQEQKKYFHQRIQRLEQ